MPFSIFSRRFWFIAVLGITAAPRRACTAFRTLLQGKRVRGWNQLSQIVADRDDFYRYWVNRIEPGIIEEWIGPEINAAATSIAALVIGSSTSGEDCFNRSCDSVRRAFGDRVKIFSYNAPAGTHPIAAATHRSVAEAVEEVASEGHDWILPIFAGDQVSPHLGRVLDKALIQKPQASIIFWDEDRLDESGRAEPWIKPDWDQLLFLARDGLTACGIVRSSLAVAASSRLGDEKIDPTTFHRISLNAITLAGSDPHHVPLILSHRSQSAPRQSATDRCGQISEDWPAPIRCEAGTSDFAVIIPEQPTSWPKVSILIPTKDRGELLEACTGSLALIKYEGELEIIIIDNGTTQAHARQVLDRLASMERYTILNAPGPFNFSALNNLAASKASGDLLCLLNNDVEAIDGSWLKAMVCHAAIDGVGAVGAQLIYPDHSIQHAGVAIGVGAAAAGHVEKGRHVSDRRFYSWHSVSREVSAVTAACLMVKRETFNMIGGFDEERFPVAFNDVDFCLRLKMQGYRNLFVAEARLIHHESVSRGDDNAPANTERFQRELAELRERWGTREYRDPHFSPLFATSSERCVLAV